MDAAQFDQYCRFLAQNEQDNRTARQLASDSAAQRHLVDKLIKQTALCDGSSTTPTRAWLDDIALALNRAGANHIVEIVTSTISGSLRKEVERFIQAHITREGVLRAAVPWDQLRAHIVNSFLHVDEAAALRDEVERVKQSAYEQEASYNRRFRDVADAAYSVANRNADQNRILVRAYARGLQSTQMAVKLIQDGNPQTLEEAIDWVAQFSERRDAVSRLGLDSRREEPMEIGPSRPAVRSMPQNRDTPPYEVSALLKKMLISQEKLSAKIANLAAATAKPQTAFPRPRLADGQFRNDVRQHQPTRDPPRCFYCGQPGHLRRDCRLYVAHGRPRPSRQPGNELPLQRS